MEYDIQIHGDTLEREASTFIREKFINYENVWKKFIGNTGKEKKADLPDYPNESKRQEFSENSYTVLESSFILHKIVESKILSSAITNIDEYIEFNKSFIAFFAHVGRLRDNLLKASRTLSGYDNKDLESKLKEFWEARHIVIHGKIVPTNLDDLSLIQMPRLASTATTSYGWNDKKIWSDSSDMPMDYAGDTCEDLLVRLQAIVNSAYGNFHNIIESELRQLKTKIQFTYDKTKIGVNVYNINLPLSGSNHDTNQMT